MTQPAIDQNTLLAEARQALEKLDRMKAAAQAAGDREESSGRFRCPDGKKAAGRD